MSKRRRFIITSILLTLGFLFIQFLDNKFRFFAIGGLSLFTIILFYWSLVEGLGRDLTLLVLILPFFFTIGVGLFWFLLPFSVFTRIPILLFYAAGIYSLCLTMNIYTVSAIRTIALLRAARGVGFVLSLVTSFLIFDAIISLRLPFYFTTPLIGLFSFPIYFQGLWSLRLNKEYEKDLSSMALTSALITAEVSLLLFFWPVTVVVGSLFLTVSMYMLLGLGQALLEARLFKQTAREYLMVGVIVFIGMFLATRWGG